MSSEGSWNPAQVQGYRSQRSRPIESQLNTDSKEALLVIAEVDAITIDSLTVEALDPLAPYKIADEESLAVTTKYYGFLKNDGAWIILRQATLTSPYTYRYANASNNGAVTGYHSGGTPAWTNRATLTYDYFDVLTGL